MRFCRALALRAEVLAHDHDHAYECMHFSSKVTQYVNKRRDGDKIQFRNVYSGDREPSLHFSIMGILVLFQVDVKPQITHKSVKNLFLHTQLSTANENRSFYNY